MTRDLLQLQETHIEFLQITARPPTTTSAPVEVPLKETIPPIKEERQFPKPIEPLIEPNEEEREELRGDVHVPNGEEIENICDKEPLLNNEEMQDPYENEPVPQEEEMNNPCDNEPAPQEEEMEELREHIPVQNEQDDRPDTPRPQTSRMRTGIAPLDGIAPLAERERSWKEKQTKNPNYPTQILKIITTELRNNRMLTVKMAMNGVKSLGHNMCNEAICIYSGVFQVLENTFYRMHWAHSNIDVKLFLMELRFQACGKKIAQEKSVQEPSYTKRMHMVFIPQLMAIVTHDTIGEMLGFRTIQL